MVVDIGGEGRHPEAWNVNPRQFKTFGPHRGDPIPRLIRGRAEQVPLPDRQVDMIIVERAPLSRKAIDEIKRIARPGALVVLRHVRPFGLDPHVLAKQVLCGEHRECECRIGSSVCQETVIELGGCELSAALARSS